MNNSQEKITNRAFSTSEVAQILGVTQRTVQRYIENGDLKGIRTGARKMIVPQKALEEYLKKLNGGNYEYCYWEQDPNPETIEITVPIPNKEKKSNGKKEH